MDTITGSQIKTTRECVKTGLWNSPASLEAAVAFY